MKEHVQKPGVRKWAGEDLIELQGESLTAIQALVEPYAPCIIQGCEVSQANGVYQVQPGIVALKGSNEDGNACTKIVRFEGYTGAVMPIYLIIKVTPYLRVYADEENKPIAYEYTAESSTTQPSVPYLKIDTTGGERLVDTIGITQKLDREGGNASNVKVVSFVSSNDRSNIEAGSSLKELFGKIRRWFNDLGKLAFKNTVGTSDFDDDLNTAFNDKVDKDGDKVLSECDFKKSYEDKLNGIAEKAQVNVKANWSETNAESDAFIQNKPTISSLLHSANPGTLNPTDDAIIVISGNNGTDKTTYYKKPLSLLWNWIKSKLKTVATSGSYNDLTDKPDAATQSAAGFMSAEDKTKLDNIAAGANNYTHPTTEGNKHIPSGGSSGQYLKRGTSSGTAVWAKPTAAEIGAAASYHSHDAATQSVAGFMSAADKKKLDNIEDSEKLVGQIDSGRDVYPGDTMAIAGNNVILKIGAATEKMCRVGARAYIYQANTSNCKFNIIGIENVLASTAAKNQMTVSVNTISLKTGMGLWSITWIGEKYIWIDFDVFGEIIR